VDWAKRKHDVVLMTPDGRVLEHLVLSHDDQGFEKLHQRIDATGVAPCSVFMAIETPHGSVVASCLLRRYCVFVLNPKQVDRFRDRYFLSGAKDDRRDAEVLASALRTDLKCFREVRPASEARRVLEQTLRLHDSLVEQRTALLNQFGELIHEYFPQFEEACEDLGAAWVRAFWKMAPTASVAQSLSEEAISELLKKHRVRRIDAKTVLARVSAKPLPLLPGVEKACVMHIRVLVEQLELVCKHLQASGAELRSLINSIRGEDRHDANGDRQLSDVDIIESLPGAGPYVTAILLADARDELGARSYERLRAVAGVAPVTMKSANKRAVIMRQASRPRLRRGVYHMARIAVMNEESLKARYSALRASGKSHGLALRIVADSMLRALTSMLKERTCWRSPATMRTEKHPA
jgi:transposase